MSEYRKVTYTVINNRLMAVKDAGTYTRIEANVFESVKADCIAAAKGRLSKYLPYFRIDFDRDNLPDLDQWRMAFSSDNSPEMVKFDERLEGYLKDVDFSKPYDAALADAIREHFIVKARSKPNVDADLIIQGELGELPEQQESTGL